MQYNPQRRHTDYQTIVAAQGAAANSNQEISCNWNVLREQLLSQWDRLTPTELESTRQDRLKIAGLLQKKYGISVDMAVNYLRNFERTLPLLGCA